MSHLNSIGGPVKPLTFKALSDGDRQFLRNHRVVKREKASGSSYYKIRELSLFERICTWFKERVGNTAWFESQYGEFKGALEKTNDPEKLIVVSKKVEKKQGKNTAEIVTLFAQYIGNDSSDKRELLSSSLAEGDSYRKHYLLQSDAAQEFSKAIIWATSEINLSMETRTLSGGLPEFLKGVPGNENWEEIVQSDDVNGAQPSTQQIGKIKDALQKLALSNDQELVALCIEKHLSAGGNAEGIAKGIMAIVDEGKNLDEKLTLLGFWLNALLGHGKIFNRCVELFVLIQIVKDEDKNNIDEIADFVGKVYEDAYSKYKNIGHSGFIEKMKNLSFQMKNEKFVYKPILFEDEFSLVLSDSMKENVPTNITSESDLNSTVYNPSRTNVENRTHICWTKSGQKRDFRHRQLRRLRQKKSSASVEAKSIATPKDVGGEKNCISTQDVSSSQSHDVSSLISGFLKGMQSVLAASVGYSTTFHSQ